MSNRDTSETQQRRKARQEALLHLRAARKTIDPALLQRAREAILRNDPSLEGDVPDGDEPVDRARTLAVLKGFLLLKRGDKKLCGEIRTMLTDKS